MQCEYSWQAYRDTCWYVDENLKRDWYSARDICANMNSTLLSLESDEKFQYFNQMYQNFYSKYDAFWLNSRTDEPKKFKWLNSIPLKQEHYGGKNPDNSGGNENTLNEGCISMSNPDGFKLNDAICSTKFEYFCECH